MKPTWIMHTDMGPQSDIQAYVQAVKESGADVIEVKYKAFSNEVPDVTVDGPVVVYGSVNFVNEARKAGKWLPGIFGDNETFTYEAWAKHYGSMLLNSPDGVEQTTIGAFCSDTRNPEEDIFVRPQHDTKSLVGAVWTAGDFKKFCMDAKGGDYAEITKDTEILIAQPYGIEAEWRLFVVDNKVVGASQYRKNGRMFKSPGAPQDVLDFADKVIAKWSPVPAYTLDLCRSAGNCYIVEAQGFNSAGHYATDIRKVAQAVNEVAINLWQKKNMKVKP